MYGKRALVNLVRSTLNCRRKRSGKAYDCCSSIARLPSVRTLPVLAKSQFPGHWGSGDILEADDRCVELFVIHAGCQT